jgi:hypothetical protein
MGSSGFNFGNTSDLYKLNNIVQLSFIRYPKDLIIHTMKEFFSKDSYYHYVRDEYGFAKVNNHTDLDIAAGIHDDLTTRIWIGEKQRFGVINYPSILVSFSSAKHVPISMSRDVARVDYITTQYVDGYGNSKNIQVPDAFVLSGAWEGTISIDVLSRSIRERDDLIELIAILFTDLAWSDCYRAGVAIKQNISIGSPGESDDRNDKLFKQTLSLEIRSEWGRRISVLNTLDTINFCVEFGNLLTSPPDIAPNLTINQQITLLDAINNLV